MIVISAEDGVMRQTKEAIKIARETGAPMVIVVTKIDLVAAEGTSKEDACQRVAVELLEHDVICESMGGTVQIVGVSSVTGEGIDDLVGALALEAEVMEIMADHSRGAAAECLALEASTERGIGEVLDAVVLWGSLKVGDHFVIGTQWGKVKRLLADSSSKAVKVAGPSSPVRIVGLRGAIDDDSAGGELLVVESESRARGC